MGPVAAVARWEYERFAKPRELVLGTLFFALMFGIFGFVTDFVESKSREEKIVAVWGGDALGLLQIEELQRFRLEHSEDLDEQRRRLADEEVDALLVVMGAQEAILEVRSQQGWQDQLNSLLMMHRQTQQLQQSELPQEVVASLLAPEPVPTVVTGPGESEDGQAGSATVLIVVGTMLLGLFLGFSYVFVAITAEKTQRITESILAAISPQQWIDGKILGLTGVVVVNVISYGVGYLLYKTVAWAAFGAAFDLPAGIGDPVLLFWVLLFAVLGFGFWFTLFALVAATISDPNSSSRSSLMFLPFLPLGLTLAGMDDPDATWMRLLALVPGVSPAAMPVRLLRGNPGLWEILVALALLAMMVWVFRRGAGRVFGVSMLMTGKEPSWGEVWRWLRTD